MNKTALKNFAIWARKKLIEDITYKAGLVGVSASGIVSPLPQSTKDLQFFDVGTRDYAQISGNAIEQRDALVEAIRTKEHDSDYGTAFAAVVEEIAYTWFNRLVAIRFMEVNDYLPSRTRVLSSENPAKNEPDLVTNPFDGDLEFTAAEQDIIMQMKDENKLDELFRMLFVKQCNKLHEILPVMFEKTSDYTELLLSISFTDKDGIVYRLTHIDGITDADWQDQVQIIGWLYQYYNTELKDETFALLKKNVKVTKERVPAATQLFTPDWIVRYMVENSLGRLWVEGHPDSNLKENWKYYLEEAEQEPAVQAQLTEIRKEYAALTPEDIKVIDPCMGSGHILVYLFDVLMQIYESQGYTQRDAAQLILEKNLYGLDIDNRASQLAYFAVMMKARQYDRRIFSRGIQPHVFAITESNGFNTAQLRYFGVNLSEIEKNNALNQAKTLVEALHDAKEYGSILTIENYDWDLLRRFADSVDVVGQMSLDSIGLDETQKKFIKLIETGEVLSQKYLTCVTNPPYMGSSNMSGKLSEFVKKNYPDSKSDLFAVFIEKCRQIVQKNGYQAMITQHAWMFLSSFEKLRAKLLNTDIVNMAHLGARAFEEIGGEVVQTTSFVIRRSHVANYKGEYCRLIEPTTQQGKEDMFLAGENRYAADQSNFFKIPGSPVAYWVKDCLMGVFNNPSLYDYTISDGQNKTGDNARFVREFWEVVSDSIGRDKKWLFYAKGGGYRKWYGNLTEVVNWSDEARSFYRKDRICRIIPEYLWYKIGITWSLISNNPSFRFLPSNATFDVGGSTVFLKNDEDMPLFLSLLNSKVFAYIQKIVNPTINIQVKDIRVMPVIRQEEQRIKAFEKSIMQESQHDWDSYETSWDFKRLPLICGGDLSIAYEAWKQECEDRFLKFKANEEELNRIFIDIYGLQDELTADVADKDITVHRVFDTKDDVPESMRGSNYVRTMRDEIVSLISYAVGCMFGRYSLDVEGLAYAGGEWDASRYSSFLPDDDNCIPITDEPYFEDDIVGRFAEFVKIVYGEDTLEKNLEFVANALGNKGATPREVIRNYFLSDFIKDHIKTYQKRPIYWLFDSGKQNGFKALVYMHRWNADTVGNLRVEYLHKVQRVYEREIQRMQETIDEGRDAREVSKATKRKDKLQKQLKETKDYDAKLAHIALSRIDIDLDDGVKVNYEKVQTARDGKKMQILAKI